MYRSHILAYIANLEEVCTWADEIKKPHPIPALGLGDIINKPDPLKKGADADKEGANVVN